MSSCLVFAFDFLSLLLRYFEAAFFLDDLDRSLLLESLSLLVSAEALSSSRRVLSVLIALTRGQQLGEGGCPLLPHTAHFQSSNLFGACRISPLSLSLLLPLWDDFDFSF